MSRIFWRPWPRHARMDRAPTSGARPLLLARQITMGLLSRMTGRGRPPVQEPASLASPEFKANPLPFYARLRAEEPVHRRRLALTGETAWLVTRYDDVAMVLKDERLVKDR